ncbi:Holliday junction branch migration protein RuvA [Helicobacter sp. faydin-H20]|uniref:Holliday junction branch migration protein RuvA n=1 Tax=Helicobacter anatolicus TaxID=2905874 RepID=UPI001E59C95A|nr:Holliday junction branch migration protein RuvA [Helicobacter anatolicus]MCE3036603.1 Holliday junction branch migration protein RuvA [Helicobacter anatolicus]
MIFGLRGKVFRLENTRVLLDVGGVIYEVNISLHSARSLENKEEVFLFATQIVREDAHLLFGFVEEIEKQTFDRLIKINGVGPKVALAILSTYSAKEFIEIIQTKNIAALQKVPGIGGKSAGKIMVDISGFYVDLIAQEGIKDSKNLAYQEAKMALESLGFKANAIDKVLKQVQKSSVQDMIKEALGLLK